MPSRLSPRERREAETILRKLDYPGFGGRAAGILLPFRPAGRAVEFALHRIERKLGRRTQETGQPSLSNIGMAESSGSSSSASRTATPTSPL